MGGARSRSKRQHLPSGLGKEVERSLRGRRRPYPVGRARSAPLGTPPPEVLSEGVQDSLQALEQRLVLGLQCLVLLAESIEPGLQGSGSLDEQHQFVR